MTAHNAWLVILLSIGSTTQTRLAKALERQGIETWDLICRGWWRVTRVHRQSIADQL